MISSSIPAQSPYKPFTKGEDNSTQCKRYPYDNWQARHYGTIPPVAVYTHVRNKLDGVEDDPITKTCIKHLTSPKRLLKNCLFVLAFFTATLPLARVKDYKMIPIVSVLGGMGCHLITAGTSTLIELAHKKGEKYDLLSELLYNKIQKVEKE